MQHDALFFIGIFIFIFLVWVATGGPSRPISFAGPFLSSPTTAGNVTTYYLPQASFGIGDSNEQLSLYGGGTTRTSLSNIQSEADRLAEQVKDAAAFGTPSPYRGLVSISKSRAGPANADYEQEYVEIDMSRQAKEGVDITGWKLISTASDRVGVIREGATVPRTGSVNPTEHIVLQPGDRAIVSTERSPIGVSFRENMCTGYLGQYQNFSPHLSLSCPDPLSEFDRYYAGNPLKDDACYDLMRDTRRCEIPSDKSRRLSSSCFDMIDNRLNYNGCVETHRNDPDFARNTTWRIYLNRDEDDGEIWKADREGIKLVDAEGKTVDLFTY